MYDNRLFLPAIAECDLENMWFQQDGATYHTTRANIALLRESFPARVISPQGDINWPPRSGDLTQLGFFVALRERPVYTDRASTLEHLKTNMVELPLNM